MKMLITVTILTMALCQSRVCALALTPPDSPSAPPPSAADIDAQREVEQGEAPTEPMYNSPPNISPNAMKPRSLPTSAAPANAFAGAMATHHTQGSNASVPASANNPGRTRGVIMMIIGLAGMAGLGLGRLLMNALSRSSHTEAQLALDTAQARPEKTRSYGSEHREYIID